MKRRRQCASKRELLSAGSRRCAWLRDRMYGIDLAASMCRCLEAYATIDETERLMPAWQCTSTRPPFSSAAWMASAARSTRPAKSSCGTPIESGKVSST